MSLDNSRNTWDCQEKRDFIRMRVDSPVTIYLKGESQPLSGICRDMSGGGIFIEVNTRLAIGTAVEVVLSSHHGNAPMLRATATVCRASTASEDAPLPIGLGLRVKNILL